MKNSIDYLFDELEKLMTLELDELGRLIEKGKNLAEEESLQEEASAEENNTNS